VNAARSRHQFVVEKVIQRPAAGHPAHLAHLPGLRFSVGILVGFGLVIIIAAFRLPIGMHLGVKGPVGYI